ncbi:MAG: alpha/beta hydrolase [Pseudomonadota bacterium]
MNAQETAATLMAQAAKWPQVETKTVTFKHAGSTLSGTLYLPEERVSAPLPIVVITGAWTTVQGQMPSVYAREMAARGFAALTFDFRGWGASGDLPKRRRYVESPVEKTSDIRAALTFASTLPEADKVFGLGICASSGYMVDAVSGNAQVAGIGLIAPWLHNREIVEPVYGGADGVSGLIEVSRAAEAAGGEIIPAAGPEGAEGVLMPIGGYYYEADRGAIPSYDNKWDNASWEGWLTYAPADNAERLDKPLAVVHSDEAAIPQGARVFLQGYQGDAPALWLDGVSQFDFYDQQAPVKAAAEAIAAHFRSL